MSDLFNFRAQRNQFAVMGNPIAHSKSPRIHQLFAQQFEMDIHYGRIQVDIGGFAQAVSHFAAHGGGGLNVTLPFKVNAFELCARTGNQLTPRAERAAAVNTLAFAMHGDENQVSGDNTDGVGLLRDIENNFGDLAGKNILVLGAGGAVRGALWHLAECRPATLTIANRTESKARDLATQLKSANDNINITGCGFERVPDLAFDLIINGTSASIAGELPDIDGACIGAHSFVYDMMYAADQKTPTAFLQWAAAQNPGGLCDGLGMLVEQAAESFYVWHGKMPDTKTVLEEIRNE